MNDSCWDESVPDCIHIDTEIMHQSLPHCKCQETEHEDCWFSYFGAPDCDFYEEKR